MTTKTMPARQTESETLEKYHKALVELKELADANPEGFSVATKQFCKERNLTTNFFLALTKYKFLSKAGHLKYRWIASAAVDMDLAKKVLMRVRDYHRGSKPVKASKKHGDERNLDDVIKGKLQDRSVAKTKVLESVKADQKVITFPEPREIDINHSVIIKNVVGLKLYVEENRINIEALSNDHVAALIKIPNKPLRLVETYTPGKTSVYSVLTI